MYHIIIVDSVLAKKYIYIYFFTFFKKIDAHPKVRTRAVLVYWDIYGNNNYKYEKIGQLSFLHSKNRYLHEIFHRHHLSNKSCFPSPNSGFVLSQFTIDFTIEDCSILVNGLNVMQLVKVCMCVSEVGDDHDDSPNGLLMSIYYVVHLSLVD